MRYRLSKRSILGRTRRYWWVGACFLLLLAWWLSLPDPLFSDPLSTVVRDRSGRLLGARIAADCQWRFPRRGHLPERYITALTAFEDKRFWYHPGVDPLAMSRAFWQNVRSRKVVSGGSTLSMQVIRMSRKKRPRTVWEKLKECWLASRLEAGRSKKGILDLYAAHAPYGGNVVGIDAAAWRYFGKNPESLSWAEAATLAVLPNSPALIHPGRNRSALREKRDRLLHLLLQREQLDSLTFDLACSEPLPGAPLPLPTEAPHLLDHLALEREQTETITTIDAHLQSRIAGIMDRHMVRLKSNGIHNLAVLVLDVRKNEVLAYHGNLPATGNEHSPAVDIIQAPRSPGSLFKPFLFASLLEAGQIAPQSLVPDVPVNYAGFRPENYSRSYDGMVPAGQALVRSLNVPFIRLLERFGLGKFHYQLEKLGITTLKYPPHHYGLPLILGGGDASLWDLTNAYASLARILNGFSPRSGQYSRGDLQKATFFSRGSAPEGPLLPDPPLLSAASIWLTFETMRQLERPNRFGQWEVYRSARPIAWKTGTSYGFRDAWAIGLNPDFAVGIWAGNADGEGRPNLIGVYAAAPVLFEVFELLPATHWFEPPMDELDPVTICRKSGFRSGRHCKADTILLPALATRMPVCSLHQLLHLDASGEMQVNSDCYPPDSMVHRSWFVLPPVEAHFYQSRHPEFRPLPPFLNGCDPVIEGPATAFQLIYPDRETNIFLPLTLEGELSPVVFKAAHQEENATIFWHLDQTYLGSTQRFHHMELRPEAGEHRITLVDEKGNQVSRDFSILGRE